MKLPTGTGKDGENPTVTEADALPGIRSGDGISKNNNVEDKQDLG
jgi:hypothetical protein